MPRVCSVILVASRELDLTSDQYLGDELMFNMLLLSEMLCVPGITFHSLSFSISPSLNKFVFSGCHLIPYVGRVEQVLTAVLGIHNKDGHGQAVTILRNLLASLCTVCLADKTRIVSHRLD